MKQSEMLKKVKKGINKEMKNKNKNKNINITLNK